MVMQERSVFLAYQIRISTCFTWTDNSYLTHVRAPDNFLKQGVADASLEANGVFLQNPEVF